MLIFARGVVVHAVGVKRFLLVFVLLGLASRAEAQFYVQDVAPGAYTPLASIPGIQNVTDFDFSSTDEGNATVPIPFTFVYLSQPYTEARVAVNGYVVFGQASPFGSYVNYPIGSANGANNVIAVWWDDLIIPAVSGHGSHGTLGTAPNRIFIIEVRGWEHYGLANIDDGRWQVWLYEGVTGRFEVRVDGQLEATEDYSATTGWEGPSGAPSGAFLPCANASPYCDEVDFAAMVGNVYGVELAQGPELLGAVGLFPRGVLPGGAATGQVTLRNVGTQDVTDVESTLYLSLDQQLGAGDIIADVFTVPLLQAGDVPVTSTATVSVPGGTPPGDYYLLLQVDSQNSVAEVTEANNVAVSQARFATAYDLSALNVDAPAGANPGDAFSVDVDLGNQGVIYTGNVTVRVRASLDGTLDAGDPVVGTTTVNLTGVASQGFNLPFTLPAIPPGSYYPVLEVDPNDAIVEYDAANDVVVGAAAFPIGPELNITALTSPGGGDPGQPITFGLTIQNDGVAFSGPVTVRLIASPDPIYDVNDPLLGDTTVVLGGLVTETVQATVTMPSLPAGVYYPIAILDPNDAVDEVNDFNNTAAGADTFTSGPDVTILDVAGPTQATPGQAMMVTTTVGSPGAPFTGQVTYRLYLSEDQAYDAQDAAVGEYTVSFAGEASVDDLRMPVFPAALPPTGHYLIARADPANTLPEANEGNNDFLDDQRIGSGTDLRVLSIDYDPDIARAGDVVTVTASLRADGSPYTGGVEYRIWLSTDFYLDAGDYPIFDDTAFLNGEVDLPLSAAVTIPGTVPPDDYRVFVEVDPNDLIPEPSETNNDEYGLGYLEIVGPNLTVSSISAGPQAFVGIPYRIELTLDNAGAADSGSFRYGYYVTTNGILRPPDGQQLFVSTATVIAAGATRTFVDLVDVPAQTAPGGLVQMGVLVDFDDQVLEGDEADNLAFIPGQVQVLQPVSDLVAQIEETSTAAAAGENLAVTRTLSNQGVAASPTFTYGYYLSENAEISAADDILIGSYSTQLPLDGFDRSIDLVNVPATVPPGTYYLGLVMDPEDALPETNEANNVALGPQVRLYPASLAVRTDALPGAVLNAPYRAQLFAAGPTSSYAWSIGEGLLPPGLALDELSGEIAGTPTKDGLFEFVARVTAGNAYAERSLSIRVRGATVPIEVVSTTLPYAIVGRPYESELVAVGGAPPYTWGVRSSLPEGLTATSTGGIGGTPRSAGTYSLAVVVTDSEGTAATAQVALNVVNPDQTVVVTQAPLPDAIVGVDYCEAETIRLFASGGFPPFTWSALSGLPPGMSLASGGDLCGAPEQVGTFELLVRVADGAGVFDTSLFILRVRSGNELAITDTSLEDAVLGEVYEVSLAARRGLEPYAWSIQDGTLPAGLELAADGTIQGTPTEVGTSSFVVQVTDAASQSRRQPLSIRVLQERLVQDDGGCGCTASAGGSGRPWLGLLLGLLLLARRRH